LSISILYLCNVLPASNADHREDAAADNVWREGESALSEGGAHSVWNESLCEGCDCCVAAELEVNQGAGAVVADVLPAGRLQKLWRQQTRRCVGPFNDAELVVDHAPVEREPQAEDPTRDADGDRRCNNVDQAL
jgi:hypothetical protein